MELLDGFLSLEFHVITSDFVRNEIKSEAIKEKFNSLVKNKKIGVESLSGDELEECLRIKRTRPGLSMADCSVLFLAKKHCAILLSGDMPVRTTAKAMELEYHGILWAMDKMTERGIITRKTAGEKLLLLMTINNRLPQKECQKRLDRWSR